MYRKTRAAKNRITTFGAGIVLWFGAQVVSAATQEITAVFRPDPTNPTVNRFVNTTPESGYCPSFASELCKSLGIFSIRSNDIKFTSTGPMPAGPGVSERQGVMFKVPSEWRRFDVVSERGEHHTVEVRIAGVGNRFDVKSPATIDSWNGRFNSAPTPCLSTGFGAGHSQMYLWFWRVPENAGSCVKIAREEIPWLHYFNFEYAYELRTPNPLGMSTGRYQGSIKYTLGPNQDFDFGDIMIPNDSTLTFNFNLDVQHTLKVEVPPGGNHVELLPQGGWQAWLQRNRRPERLFRDQTFNLSASSRFKMQLECQYSGGNECLLHEPKSGHTVPLNLFVSLPGGITDASGQSVNRRALLRDGSGTELFMPGHYVDRRPGTLHFEIGREEVEKMLDGDNRTYSGNVTVVWDSEV
ncbi:hypothetical protein [Pseudomonas sp. Root562]|uniref:hypothetical protein n=1 Tax=Pseudomonas sp. Root562 TaxID=1736561 RepID=UPI0009EC7E76|nr:hypothetical protein [Pseudomonas sp. Root562]